MKLRDWATEFLRWSKQNKRSYKRDVWATEQLLDVFGSKDLTEITKPLVASYVRDRLETEDVAPATINRSLALLKRMMTLAVEDGVLEKVPFTVKQLREAPARVPSLSVEEQQRLFEEMPEDSRLAARLAVTSGFRLGEILGLQWKHVDLQGQVAVVQDSKSGSGRYVPLHPSLVAELTTDHSSPDEFLVKGAARTVSKHFKKAARKIGRGDLRFHDLRHVAGSRFLAAGAALPEVADLLGHKTMVCARRYAHTSHKRLSNLLKEVIAA